MPIYQRHVFPIVKPLLGTRTDEKLFTIDHTGEQFKDESEYLSRCELYSREVWSCQCTGHSGLTHQQAWESEQRVRAMLDKQFPSFLVKPVLSVVHHNTKPLDAVIDETHSLIHSRLHKDEAVLCLRHDKALGHVVDVTDPENACGSPSSDKENAKEGDGGRLSKEDGATASGRFPAQLPLRYTVRLAFQDRLLTGLSPAELTRAQRLPSRDLLRLFIRSSAVRQGTSMSAPWVVSPALFVEHGLKNKIASIFLPAADRKSQSSVLKSSLLPKKRKLKDENDKRSKKPKTVKEAFKATPTDVPKRNKLTTSKLATAKLVVPNGGAADSDSDLEVLASVVSSPKPKDPLKEKAPPGKARCSSAVVVISPLKSWQSQRDYDSDDDVKLSVLAKSPVKKLAFVNGSSSTKKGSVLGKRGGNSLAKQGSAKYEAKKPKQTEKRSNKKQDVKKETVKKKRGRPTKEESAKKMKQMSLFDLGKKKPDKAPQKTPKSPKKMSHSPQKPSKSPQKLSKPPHKTSKSPQKSATSSPQKLSLPPCVRKLTREIESGKKISMVNPLLNTCVNVLRREQVALIAHEPTRALILKRRASVEEGRLLARMTSEQRDEYLRRKKERQREERKVKQVERRMEKLLRFEDQSLQLSPLPVAAPVSLPASLPPGLFGDVASVVEFFSCYSALLGAEAAASVGLERVAAVLAGGAEHETELLQLVVPLLKVLINDKDEESEELGAPLRRVPATPQTASELVRLTLQPDMNEDGGPDCHWLRPSLLARLETCELFEFSAEGRAEVLVALVHRVLASDAAAEHQETVADQLRALWNKKFAIYKDRKAADPAATSVATAEPAKPPEPPVEAAAAASQAGADTAEQDAEPSNSARAARLRRNPDEARKEKEKREAEAKERREALLQQEQKKRNEEEVMRKFDVVSAQHAAQQRRVPLGQDRHHRRYWLLPSLPAAVYVETGWAAAETLQYRVPPPGQDAEKAEAVMDAADDSDDEQPLKALQQRAAAGLDDMKQVTLPEPGENQWYQYTSIREVDALLAALAEKGVRESKLRTAIAAHYPTINTLLAAGASHVKSADANVSFVNNAKPGNLGAGHKSEADSDNNSSATTATAGPSGTCNDSTPDEKTTANADTGIDAKESLQEPAEGCTDSSPTLAATEPSSGRQFLLASLKEDLLSIEEELTAGGIGGVPDGAEWADRVLSCDQQLAPLVDALRQCHSNVLRHALQGSLATEAGEQRWLKAVAECRTLSRLHVLVGLFDSAIKWDISNAEKKCKVCRRRGEGEVAVCGGCYQLYHWRCQRPRLEEPPGPDWRCAVCRPVTQRLRAKAPTNVNVVESASEEEEEDEPEKEDECRVCGDDNVEDMIFCTRCPAAFHKNCHHPPVSLRIRPGWECMDCQATSRIGRSTRGKTSRKKQPLPSELLRAARDADQEETSEDDEEEEAENEESEADGEDNGEDEDTEEGENVEEEEQDEEVEDSGDEAKSEGDEEEETTLSPSPQRRSFIEEKAARSSAGRRAAAGRRISSDPEPDGDIEDQPARRGSGGRRAPGRRSNDGDDSGEPPARSGSGGRRAPGRRRRSSDRDDSWEPPAQSGSGGRRAPGRRRRSSNGDDSGEWSAPRSKRRAAAPRGSVSSRRRSSGDTTRNSERSSGRAPVRYTEHSENDLEPSRGTETAAQPPATRKEPSPSKLDLVQRPDAACVYCSQPRAYRNELAVCRTCPALYHRRCAKRAGLVDAWQCAACVMPDMYRPRPARAAATATVAAASAAAEQDSEQD